MAKTTAKLRAMDLRGETVHTKWGPVSFGMDGLAELEVDEADLPLLRGLRWLLEAPTHPQEIPVVDPELVPALKPDSEPMPAPVVEPDPEPTPAPAPAAEPETVDVSLVVPPAPPDDEVAPPVPAFDTSDASDSAMRSVKKSGRSSRR